MLTIYARLTTTEGRGVGRWKKMYEAEDARDAQWRIGHLVPTAQVKVTKGRDTVLIGIAGALAERVPEL